jgi:membrane protease YdiL (CAAX protease family)
MAAESKTILAGTTAQVPSVTIRVPSIAVPFGYRRYFVWAQIVLGFLFMEFALWTSNMAVRNRWVAISAITIMALALVDRPSWDRLGLRLPTTLGAGVVIMVSLGAAALMVGMVSWAGGSIPANPTWPNLHLAWQYLVWAMVQEFILQSFFFTRCEELWGGTAAVWITATLFAAAHLPSPILTTLTLIAALFFCEMFRRYRSIYPIGIVHGLLGLTVSLTMPDSILHHMRVGIGYLSY